jgi:kinesin family protein 20
MPKPPHVYSFDRVFGPTSSQTDFFANTALPLVDQLLKGENGLLFAYGVSNSGKTYSVSGGNTINSADRGVLPRAIDVVFNSIKGLESNANVS